MNFFDSKLTQADEGFVGRGFGFGWRDICHRRFGQRLFQNKLANLSQFTGACSTVKNGIS